jgi:predicted TPR repeat methyltransferase
VTTTGSLRRTALSTNRGPVLREARVAYRNGRTAEADALCRRMLRAYPTHSGTLHVLGNVYAARGDNVEAARILEQALAYCPHNVRAWCDLAAACHNCALSEDAIHHLKHVILLRPTFVRAYAQLVNLYHELGRIPDAAALYRDWAGRDPGNAEVLHMAAATSSGPAPARCSVEYVRTHFNKLAPSFDKRLVEDLGYSGHKMVVAALSGYASAGAPWPCVLDAGCGTGLCGPLLRPFCRRLVGVDLAQQMIKQARRRGSYDELVRDELSAFMNSRPRGFDAILSSDVLIYIGKLDEPVRAARRALKRGGLLVVTFEALPKSEPASYRLQANGRYSHHEGYIRKTLAAASLKVLQFVQAPLRREFGRDVLGFLAVAQKQL